MPILLFVALCLLLCSNPSHAQPLRLATLEYPPYSSEHLRNGGSIVELTRRAFATQGYAAQIDFLPWARVRAAQPPGPARLDQDLRTGPTRAACQRRVHAHPAPAQ